MDIIDFVVPWVDDTDIKWQSKLHHYKKEAYLASDISNSRFRDWGLFKYWFRGVEKYAPWVNKVHLITEGHLPKWLNVNHPKLNLVKHADYIPLKYLPTFSSHPIELNMHKIEGLSEKFVYFNDDFYIINKCTPKTFFTKNIPNDAAILTAYNGLGFSKIQLNHMAIINNRFDKKEVIKSKLFNWINPVYGKSLLRSLLLLPWNKFTGIYDQHLPNSFLKSTLEEVWEKEFEILDHTSSNRFRNLNEDVSQYLFRFWQLASNNFHPSPKHKLGDYCPVGILSNEKVLETIKKSKKTIIVLNDHEPENIDQLLKDLTDVFENKFPDKSSFEL